MPRAHRDLCPSFCCFGVYVPPPPPPPPPAAQLLPAVHDQVMRYRGLLNVLSKNSSDWAAAARELRLWMQQNDPDYPLYHLTAPEGWNKCAAPSCSPSHRCLASRVARCLSSLELPSLNSRSTDNPIGSDPNGVTYDPHTRLYHRFYQ